jgi:hypothetical protein
VETLEHLQKEDKEKRICSSGRITCRPMKARGSALYVVVVVALIMSILCFSIILAAYYYKLQIQVKQRRDDLTENLYSGIALLCRDSTGDYRTPTKIDLFDTGRDSVSLNRFPFGIYDVGVVKAFRQRDTLMRAITIGMTTDTGLYAVSIIDENRPLSLTGHTSIKGACRLPAAGLREAFVNNQGYLGAKPYIQGSVKNSMPVLPALRGSRLSVLEAFLTDTAKVKTVLPKDSLSRPFEQQTYVIRAGKQSLTLERIKLSGNIILLSDTIVTIDSSARLQDVVIAASSIVVRAGFKGKLPAICARFFGHRQRLCFSISKRNRRRFRQKRKKQQGPAPGFE